MKRHLSALLCLLFTVYASATPNYEYALQDHAGKTITQKDFPKQYQLIAFGYTHCPDVCPTTLFDFKQLMAKTAHPEEIQPIFITIDPTRDTADTLEKYISYFDPRILGLHGSRAATDAAAANFNASYGYQIDGKKVNADTLPPGTNYNVYHSTLIYLLNPKGELIDVFDYQSSAANLLQSVQAAIAEDRS